MNKDIKKLIRLRMILFEARERNRSRAFIIKLRCLVIRQEKIILQKIVQKYAK